MKVFKVISLLLVSVFVLFAFTGCGALLKRNNNKIDDTDGRPTGKRAEADTVQIKAFLEDAKPGDRFTLGAWEQDGSVKNGAEGISWTVLYQDVGKALVLAENVLEYIYFKNPDKDVKFARCLYKDSDIRTYLNSDFYNNAFTDNERSLILKSVIKTNYVEDYQNKTYETEDSVFLLSIDEVSRYVTGVGTRLHGIPTDYLNSRYGKYMSPLQDVPGIEKAMSWWLRDMGSNSSNAAYVAGFGKKPDTTGWDIDSRSGLRPAMWIVYNESDMKAYEKGEIHPKPDQKLDQKIASLHVGDKFTFGRYDLDPYDLNGYEDFEWLVLDEDETSFLIFSVERTEQRPFLERVDGKDPENVNWAVSSLRTYLNSDDFISGMFSPQEKAKLLLTHVTTDESAAQSYGREPGGDTDDYLFIPERAEIERYFPNEASRGLGGTATYWLRSSQFVVPYMDYVFADGSVGSNECTAYSGVRLMARIKK